MAPLSCSSGYWIESTKYSAKYRIADEAFKGGKTVKVLTGKGAARPETFHYGHAVSKRKVQPGRELFNQTHIEPDQYPAWWDLIIFSQIKSESV